MISSSSHNTQRPHERGNILFMILLAIVLIGLLTAAILNSNRPEGANIDKEALVIRASEAQRAASEFERGVLFVMQQNGKSEADIRFAHPQASPDYGDLSADSDKTDQIFGKGGGDTTYRMPPPDINDGSKWEFFGTTAAPQVGSNKADLMAVLPNVTEQFCQKINDVVGQTTPPTDSSDCVYPGTSERFDNGSFDLAPNTMDESSFVKKPALQACVQCDDDKYYYYYVLLAR